jgi:hypothetical protein
MRTNLPDENAAGNFLSGKTLLLVKGRGHDNLTSQPMTHPADYLVVVSPDDDYLNGYHHFTEKVNRRLRAGYQLHGQPFNIERIVCQAMVKPAEEKIANGHVFSENSADTTAFYQHAAHA